MTEYNPNAYSAQRVAKVLVLSSIMPKSFVETSHFPELFPPNGAVKRSKVVTRKVMII
jgi:hypothetical protein